jgi:hypothetical protein
MTIDGIDGIADLTALARRFRDPRHLLCPAPAFLQQRLSHLPEFLERSLVDARKPQIERVQRADDGGADHHAREPSTIWEVGQKYRLSERSTGPRDFS